MEESRQHPHPVLHGRHMLPDIDTLGYIQCVTCGKMIGNLYNKADELRRKNLTEIEVYEELGLKRTCCRYHLTLGIKMPMVKYLDENVRLDLNTEQNTEQEELQGTTEANSTSNSSIPNSVSDQQSKDKEKVNGIKSRLAKLRDASNQVMGNHHQEQNKSESASAPSKRISMFVAT
jgi:DNA-directed RNA polymerase subunit N (RpoN/RPB10)